MIEDRQHLQEIRKDRMRRLRVLEARAAREGFTVAPEVTIEIEQIRRDLGLVNAVISSPVSQEAVDAVGPGGQYVALDKKLDQVVELLSERMDRMEENSHEWRTTERNAREVGQQGHRLIGRITLVVSVAALGVAMVALVVVAFIAVRVF